MRSIFLSFVGLILLISPAVAGERDNVNDPSERAAHNFSDKVGAIGLAIGEAFRLRDTFYHSCTVPNGELYGHCEQSYFKEPCDKNGSLSNGWKCVKAWVPTDTGAKALRWVYPIDKDAYALAVREKNGTWSKDVMTAGGITDACVSRGDCEATIISKRSDYKPCALGDNPHPSNTGSEPLDQYCSRAWVQDDTGAERLTFVYAANVPAKRHAYLSVNNEWK